MKRIRNILVIMIALLTVLSMAGCDFLFGPLVGGRVVNVKSDVNSDYTKSGSSLTLEGSEIVLTELDTGNKYYAYVDSDGSFSANVPTAGMYRVSGSKTGWAFIPVELFIGGSILVLPDFYAYPIPTASDGEITVVLAWENIDYDIDLKATYGATRSSDNPNIIQSSEFGSTLPDGILSGGVEGYGPGYYLKLDRDVRDTDADSVPRVETITLKGNTSQAPLGTLNDDNGHEIRFYADYFELDGATGSLTGVDTVQSAYATMHVMFGTEHYGTWELPLNTAENTLNALNVYVYDYQLQNPSDTSGQTIGFSVYTTGNWGNDTYRSIQE